MSRFEAKCPSCGAPVAFESAIAFVAVCAYCRGLVLRDAEKISLLGKVGELHKDASPLQLGVRGSINGRAFTLIGRLQVAWEDGLWNEWFLDRGDGASAWLGEAQGLYAISTRVEGAGELPEHSELSIGRPVRLAGRDYAVKEIREARYDAAEGQLPFSVPFGEAFHYADLAGEDSAFATIDYSEDPPWLFAGRYANFEDFAFKGLRSFDGW